MRENSSESVLLRKHANNNKIADIGTAKGARRPSRIRDILGRSGSQGSIFNSSKDESMDAGAREEQARINRIINTQLLFDDSEDENRDKITAETKHEEETAKAKLPWYTLDHASKPRNVWDLFIIVLALWNCIFIPFEVAFKPEKSDSILVSDRACDILFAVDIVVNFMTTYVNPKTNLDVTDPTRIVKNYVFGGRFWVDLLASIPFDLLIVAEAPDPNVIVEPGEGGIDVTTVTGLLKMVRLLRLGRIITKFRMKSGFKVGFRIFQLIFLLVLLLHWLACVWFMSVDLPGTRAWIPPKDLDAGVTSFFDDTIGTKYMICFYYATLLIVGNESGPTTIPQMVISSLIVILGSMFTAYIFGNMVEAMKALNKKAEAY